VHLVGFYYKEFVTMRGHTNVKLIQPPHISYSHNIL